MGQISAITKRLASPAKLQEREFSKLLRDFFVDRGWRYIRMQRSVAPGSFSTGEPGMCDYLFVHYFPYWAGKIRYGAVLHVWVEVKSKTGRVGPMQVEWQQREAERGAAVWLFDGDIEWLESEYAARFGWLHSGDAAHGQLDLLGELRKERA